VSCGVRNWVASVHGSHVEQQPGSVFCLLRNDKWLGVLLFLKGRASLQKLGNEWMARVDLQNLQQKEISC